MHETVERPFTVVRTLHNTDNTYRSRTMWFSPHHTLPLHCISLYSPPDFWPFSSH